MEGGVTYRNHHHPLLVAGVHYSIAFSSIQEAALHLARKVRYPSLNDLYWQPGGNPDLKAESGYTSELTYLFHIPNITIRVSPFFNTYASLIQWVPGKDGQFTAENSNHIQVIGSHLFGIYTKHIHSWDIVLRTNWQLQKSWSSYDAHKIQRPYVPVVTGSHEIAIERNQLRIFYQMHHQSQVNITSDGSEHLEGFSTMDAGITYAITLKALECATGFQCKNLLNKFYYTTPNNPLPGRQFCIRFTLTL
jgi:iron complex outermembrane receptor protein